MVKFKLGVDLSFAKKRWPEPEVWLDIVKNKLGLRHVEFDSDFLDPLYVSEPARSEIAHEISEIAERQGVEIHNYYTGTMTHCVNLISHPDSRVRKDGIIWCEEAIRLATKLGAKGIGGHFDTISSRDLHDPERYNQRIDNLIQAFQHLSRLAKDQGHEFILWEQMYTPSEVPYTIEQSKELFKRVNKGSSLPILITLDVGHACCHNFRHVSKDEDPYEWLREFAVMSPVVHIQQTSAGASCHWPFTKEFNKLGIIDGAKVLETIRSTAAVETLLVLEIFFPLTMPDEEVMKAMRASVNYWNACIERYSD